MEKERLPEILKFLKVQVFELPKVPPKMKHRIHPNTNKNPYKIKPTLFSIKSCTKVISSYQYTICFNSKSFDC